MSLEEHKSGEKKLSFSDVSSIEQAAIKEFLGGSMEMNS
jgi:hypothetical protein